MKTTNNSTTYIIAEMSANHGGNLKKALEIVEKAYAAGANCLKTQTYTADSLTIDCQKECFQIKNGLWKSQYLYQLYETAYTPWEWQSIIKEKCDTLGMDFLSTPFDTAGVDLLDDLGVSAYKIASFELVDLPLIAYAAAKKKTMFLSCGMATVDEIWDAIRACEQVGNTDIVLMKCCSEYPAEYGNMHLSTIKDMQQTFQYPVGLSDHGLGTMSSIIACSLDACVIEKHFCLSRSQNTPDSAFSLEPAEFKLMVEQIRQVELIKGTPMYGPSNSEITSMVFRRSIFAVRDILPGEEFTPENIRIIRPGYGIAPKYYSQLLGRTSKRSIQRGDPIVDSDLEYSNENSIFI